MFQLENQYRLFDYSININDVIQLIVVASSDIETNSTEKAPKILKDQASIQCSSSATSSVTEEVNILL